MFCCHRRRCLGANGAFDAAAAQPGHLDRQSCLTSGDGELGEKKIRMFIMKLTEFRCKQRSFRPGEQFFRTRPQLASQLTRWAKS